MDSQTGNPFSFENSFSSSFQGSSGRMMALMQDMEERHNDYEKEYKERHNHVPDNRAAAGDNESDNASDVEAVDLLPTSGGSPPADDLKALQSEEHKERLASKRRTGIISPTPSNNERVASHSRRKSLASGAAEIVQSSDDQYSLQVQKKVRVKMSRVNETCWDSEGGGVGGSRRPYVAAHRGSVGGQKVCDCVHV
jgi:hypothetical protein